MSQNILNSALPLIKTIIDPNVDLNKITNGKNSQFYQGSLILQIPEKSNENLNLNVFNNFIYNNSSIFQIMQDLKSNQYNTDKNDDKKKVEKYLEEISSL